MAESMLDEFIGDMKKCALDTIHEKYGELCKFLLDMHEINEFAKSVYLKIHSSAVVALSDEQLDVLLSDVKATKEKARLKKVTIGDSLEILQKEEDLLTAYKNLSTVIKSNNQVDYSVLEGLNSKVLEQTTEEMPYIGIAKQELSKYKSWINNFNEYLLAKTSCNIKLKEKFALANLESFIKEAKEIPHISLVGELKTLSEDMGIRSQLELRASSCVKAIQNSEQKVTVEEIGELIDSLCKLPIHDLNIVYDLKVSRWIIQSNALWASKKGNIDDWTSLLNERQLLLLPDIPSGSSKELLQQDKLEELINHVREAVQLKKQVNDLIEAKSNKHPATYIQSLLERLGISKVNFDTEINALKNILKEGNKLQESFKVLQLNRADLIEFERLRGEIARAPIFMDYLEKELQKVLETGRHFNKRVDLAIQDATHRKVRLTHRVAEDILKDYFKLCFRTREAENLQKKYEDSKQDMEKIKIRLENMKSKDVVNMDEVSQVAEALFKLPIDMGNEENKIHAEIWRMEYEGLITFNSKLEYKPSLNTLKRLLSEVTHQKELNSSSDQNKGDHIHKIVREAEGDVGKITNCHSVAELDTIEKQLTKKYIDYSEFIIEQKTRIELGTVNSQLKKKRLAPEDEVSKIIEPRKENQVLKKSLTKVHQRKKLKLIKFR